MSLEASPSEAHAITSTQVRPRHCAGATRVWNVNSRRWASSAATLAGELYTN